MMVTEGENVTERDIQTERDRDLLLLPCKLSRGTLIEIQIQQPEIRNKLTSQKVLIMFNMDSVLTTKSARAATVIFVIF